MRHVYDFISTFKVKFSIEEVSIAACIVAMLENAQVQSYKSILENSKFCTVDNKSNTFIFI